MRNSCLYVPYSASGRTRARTSGIESVRTAVNRRAAMSGLAWLMRDAPAAPALASPSAIFAKTVGIRGPAAATAPGHAHPAGPRLAAGAVLVTARDNPRSDVVCSPR